MMVYRVLTSKPMVSVLVLEALRWCPKRRTFGHMMMLTAPVRIRLMRSQLVCWIHRKQKEKGEKGSGGSWQAGFLSKHVWSSWRALSLLLHLIHPRVVSMMTWRCECLTPSITAVDRTVALPRKLSFTNFTNRARLWTPGALELLAEKDTSHPLGYVTCYQTSSTFNSTGVVFISFCFISGILCLSWSGRLSISEQGTTIHAEDNTHRLNVSIVVRVSMLMFLLAILDCNLMTNAPRSSIYIYL